MEAQQIHEAESNARSWDGSEALQGILLINYIGQLEGLAMDLKTLIWKGTDIRMCCLAKQSTSEVLIATLADQVGIQLS